MTWAIARRAVAAELQPVFSIVVFSRSTSPVMPLMPLLRT